MRWVCSPALSDSLGLLTQEGALFELLGVCKQYGAHVALAPLDLQVEKGRTTVLIGPSGCGKSTTLRILCGLVLPDAGRVVFDGTPVTRATLQTVRRHLGYVIQSGGLFPHLTALENLALQPLYLRWAPERIHQRVATLAKMTQLEPELLGRYPQQLSGGQRQRVSLMRALMLDPEVLLLDEPLGALDPVIRADLQRDLRDIFRRLDKTVVLVTHDMGEAAYFGDTIVLMRDGRVVQQGNLRELVHEPAEAFVRDFINAQRSPLDEMAAKEA